ncbi:hypothetical protein MD484_g5273, partial [Candolleomyces efflorescens]
MPGAFKSSSSSSSQSSWPPPPPANETPDQRKARLEEEALAKKRSDQIDKELNAEKESKKRKLGAKILLLASICPKSLSVRGSLYPAPPILVVFANFNAYSRGKAEIWRPVVHLNLVRSVNFILSFLTSRLAGLRESSLGQSSTTILEGGSIQINPEIRKLILRLAPLRQVEETLNKALAGSPGMGGGPGPNATAGNQRYNPAKATEVSVPSGYGWKNAIIGRRSQESSTSSSSDTSELGQTRRVLAACGDDIVKLWNDRGVQHALKSAEIALEEQPGFFLDEAARITEEDYVPLPEDVLKARVTTIGPEAHVIHDEKEIDSNAREWTIYDVGGSRSQRAAWAQFFDDVNIIIFLAPMSGFNQVLAEDESVNRLTDSLRLWQTICSNKILANLEFVIFLNKLDILAAKLKSGIQFSQFVTSYVDKPNETKPVAKYLLDVFVSLHQQNSPRKRKLHPHLTCAVDTKATSSVITRIRDMILVKFLSQTSVL